MANNFLIEARTNYIRVELGLNIDKHGVITLYRELSDLPEAKILPRKWVMNAPDGTEFTQEVLYSLSETGKGYVSVGRAAFVAQNDLTFGMVRQLLMMHPRDSDSFKVFRSEAEALEWLGVSGA